MNSLKWCFPNLGDDENPLERVIKLQGPPPHTHTKIFDLERLELDPGLCGLNQLPRGVMIRKIWAMTL